MPITIPRLTYLPKTPTGSHLPCIKVDGEIVCHIEDINEFYSECGYTRDVAKAGLLPDEFLWEEYFSGAEAKRTACFQVHLIKYLMKHSASFCSKYGQQCADWIATYTEARTECGVLCQACSLEVPL